MRLTSRDGIRLRPIDSRGVDAIYKKLAAYEDAEEQGLLVRLPCKVGDTVYEAERRDGRMSNGPMNMDEAHFLLDKWYQEVRENPNIYNPVAYALYQAWKIADCRKRAEPKGQRGEWIVCGDGKNVPYLCSHCGKTVPAILVENWAGVKYCPMCGEPMHKDGDGDV
jgi:hypothetical protein